VHIDVTNPDGVNKGVKSMTLNGQLLADNLVPVHKLKDDNYVVVVMG
jgi:cellobiose phosphorylase